jgi:signal transduction histidine kinase
MLRKPLATLIESTMLTSPRLSRLSDTSITDVSFNNRPSPRPQAAPGDGAAAVREPLPGLSLATHLLLPVAIFVITLLSIDFARITNLIPIVWPPPALVLAALLRHRFDWRNFGSIVFGAALAIAFANITVGNSPAFAATMTAANIFEAVLAFAALSACGVGAANLCSIRSLLVFVIVAGCVAPMLSATVAVMASGALHGMPWRTMWLNWYPAHALGLIILVPFLVSATAKELRRLDIEHRIGEVATILAFLFFIGAFASYFRVVLFIVVPTILFVTLRLGVVGSTMATLLVALFSCTFVVFGIGQPILTQVLLSDRIMALQIFLALTALWALSIASLLSERDKLLDDLSQANSRLEIESERKSHLVVGLRRHLSVAEERERLRLSHELHDQAGQSLVATILELNEIDALVDGRSRERLHAARKRMEEMGKTLHRIAWELRPPSIDDLGLRKALASYIADWGEQCGTAVDFHCDDLDLDAVPSEIGTAVYRVVQEALTNIVKHARQPANVGVVIRRSGATLQVTIEDDGCGFDVAAAQAKGRGDRGIGIDGMRERLSLIGGTLEIESAADAGTTLFARIALDGLRAA